MSMTGTQHDTSVQLDSYSSDTSSHSFRFCGLKRIISTNSLQDVMATMQQVEDAVASGLHAAGFVSYEAGAGFNPELTVAPASDLPLVWFGLFQERHTYVADCTDTAGQPGNIIPSSPKLAVSRERYEEAVASIKNAIAAGETYQVNFTTRAQFNFEGNSYSLYNRICNNQKSSYCAYIDTGKHQILSASPELFFSLKAGIITMKPMKGTAQRLPNAPDDQLQCHQLTDNEKELAENLMIVDLVRNDLSRIAQTGSVKVDRLFEVETYPTVHQMTSTVSARTLPKISICHIFQALFPCGSITGAPKRRTMEIINQLEDSPRGVYCGAIGYISPGNEATFSVAIRTVVMEKSTGKAEMGVGSGITWDSDAESEFSECWLKSQFLTKEEERFSLICASNQKHTSSVPEGHLLPVGEEKIHPTSLSSAPAREGKIHPTYLSSAPAGEGKIHSTSLSSVTAGHLLPGGEEKIVPLAHGERVTEGRVRGLKFSLIESIRHDSGGYLLLKRHLERLAFSAGYFGITPDMAGVKRELEELGKRLHSVHKVRLLLAADGSFTLETQKIMNTNSDIMATVAISEQRPSPDDPFLYHKTTNRQLYDRERKKQPHCYDVIFFNSNGELTEGSYNNIVLLLDGKLLTPSIHCGLLPGVMREELLQVGAIEEAVLTLAELKKAEKIWLINSVRGWRECRLLRFDVGAIPTGRPIPHKSI